MVHLPLPSTHTQPRTTNKRIGSAVHFVDAPDILRQRCSLVSPRTPPLDPRTQPPCPIRVVDCFDVFIGCIIVRDGKVGIIKGLDQLTTVSADGLFRTVHDLMVMDPTSSILVELYRRYNTVFPAKVDFTGLPFYPTMTAVHSLIDRFGNPRYVWWSNNRLPGQDHIPLSRRMVEAAQVRYRQTHYRKVPRWMLRSALHFLFLGPLSPASAVADYLTIVAIDIGCNVPDIASTDERWVSHPMSILISEK